MALRMLLASSSHGDEDLSGTYCGIDGYHALTEGASSHVSHGDGHGDGHEEGHGDDAFNHIYFVMVFIASLWFAGKLAVKLKMPALVGEIVFGIILGPHLLNLPGTEGSHFLIVIGEIGLVMLVVEAGIDVDVGLLQLIGPPALGVAIMGSIFPMSMGFCISYLCFGTDIGTSIAVGACFAPTSMGIALNVLKKAKILNTPTGQLIIAAAILDDVLALIILSELGAMKDPTAAAILLPLIVSPVLILLFGYLAIRWIPKWIAALMNVVPKNQRENAILALLFIATFVMVPVCHFLGSSHLLGAFLAGLMFCTDHTIHHVWQTQIKRVLQWMLRVFFAATIGFAIPIRDFTSMKIITRGLIFCFAGLGKVITGYFARPLTKREFFTVGFSMSAWGEFAFILATASYSEGTLDQDSFSSILLAVLLSVIISPYALSFNLAYFAKRQQQKMDEHLEQYEGTNLHPVYFAINTKSRGSWGHQNKILQKLFNLKLEIIDFRSWHAPEYNHSHTEPLTKESFYVMDQHSALPPTRHLEDYEKEQLLNRVKQIRKELKQALGPKAVISIKRWLPGVSKKDDQLEPTDDYVRSMFGGAVDYKPKNRKSAEYCRKEAFKQAHKSLSFIDRKQTMNEIKRLSSRRLISMEKGQSRASSNGNAGANKKEKGGDGDRWESHSMSFSDKAGGVREPQYGDGAEEKKDGGNNANQPKSPSAVDTGMAGFEEAAAGGAGAVPVESKVINPLSHWEDEESSLGHHHNKHRDESYMSYIYGDEDSQMHKLPDYSVEHLADYGLEIFNPTLPRLNEDGDDEDENEKVENIQPLKPANNDKVEEEVEMAGNETSDFDTEDDKPTNDEDGKKKNKLTIKIYPPAMEPVSSRSPVGSDGGSPKAGYMD